MNEQRRGPSILCNTGGDTVATSAGAPAGVWQAANAALSSPYTVTADLSDSTSAMPIGLFRSVITTATYGRIEIAQKHVATTCNLTTSANSVEGDALYWNADSSLTNVVLTSGTTTFVIVASATEDESATDTTVYIQWL